MIKALFQTKKAPKIEVSMTTTNYIRVRHKWKGGNRTQIFFGKELMVELNEKQAKHLGISLMR